PGPTCRRRRGTPRPAAGETRPDPRRAGDPLPPGSGTCSPARNRPGGGSSAGRAVARAIDEGERVGHDGVTRREPGQDLLRPVGEHATRLDLAAAGAGRTRV